MCTNDEFRDCAWCIHWDCMEGEVPEASNAPNVPAPKKNLLDLALAEVRTRKQWPNGDSVVIYQTKGALAFVKNMGSVLMLYFSIKGSYKITDGLRVGYLDLLQYKWVEAPSAKDNYPAWVAEARALTEA